MKKTVLALAIIGLTSGCVASYEDSDVNCSPPRHGQDAINWGKGLSNDKEETRSAMISRTERRDKCRMTWTSRSSE